MSGYLRWRVLIVDDSRCFRDLVKECLRDRFPDLDLLEAETVAEGFRRVSECRPGLVLLDVSLPDGNGLELARRLRDELPEIAVCICTSNDYPEYRQAAAKCGAAWFISKLGTFWSDAENVVRTVFDGARSRIVLPRQQGVAA